MSSYRLAPEAEEDLAGVALYTLDTWGLEQAHRYERGLTRCMEALGDGSALTKQPIPRRPEIHSLRCQHHYIFAVMEEGSPVGIVAVLHEQMDLPTRLKERLGG